MKNFPLGLPLVALVVLSASACAVQIGSGSSGNQARAPQGSPPAAPQAAPAAPAPAPAPKGKAIGRGTRVATNPAPSPTPSTPSNANQVAPAGNTLLDVAKIQELRQRNPKACGIIDVGQNQWTRVDCSAYSPATRAIAHLSPRKSKLVSSRKTLFKPTRSLSPTIRTALGVKPTGVGAAPPRGVDVGEIIKGEAIPAAVDHRTDNLEGPIRNQGVVGSCTAFSLAATIDNAAIRGGKMQGANRDQAASANHVWSNYGFPQMGTAADAVMGKSIATISTWSGEDDKEACKLSQPGEECGLVITPPGSAMPGTWRFDGALKGKVDKSNSSGAYKVSAIEKIQTLPVNTEELVQALAGGSDLWIAMKIDGYAWSNTKIKANNGVIPDWTTSEGGHAVTMSGYRDTPTGRQYLIHNSWGTSWGDNGYAWVSEAMVQKQMHYAYKVKIDGGVAPDNLTDDDCAPDELVDLFSGLCSVICGGDLRPSNGCKQ